ncbi:MAG: PAC2 family protein [Candidatus Lokiarchaeota archaeon]
MYFNIDKKFDIDINQLNNPSVLIGWPGIALVGKLAISSIKDAIDAELFLNIEYFDFPPKSTVENGSLDIPSAQVYYKAREKGDLFILTAEYQPQSSEGVFEFSKLFCEEMDKLTNGKINLYLSSGAMISERATKENESTVYVCGTDSNLVNKFIEIGSIEIMETGVIAGANGILPAWAGQKGFAPGICLLAETIPLPMMNLDPKASKALVAVLKEFFKIDMTYDELDKQIKEMEEVFEKFKNQANSLMRRDSKQRKSEDSYFR